MSDVLSQHEIDALLSGLSTGEMDGEQLKKEENERKVRSYDFKRALRFSKEQIRGLSRIHENFARILTTALSGQLRSFVDISVASVDQVPYDEFIRSIPKMTLLNVFEAPPLEGRMLMEVNPHVGYAMLDRLLGGQGQSMNKVEKLTEIETKLLSSFMQMILESFQSAWESVLSIETIGSEIEVNPQFLQMVSPNETVVVISLTTTIGETSGMINLCLPHMVLEEILPKLTTHYWMQTKVKERDQQEVKHLNEWLLQGNISLQAILGTSSITIEELLHMERGDVLTLKQHIHDPLEVHVGSRKKFTARPGKKRSHMAVQILEKIEEGEEQHEQ